MNKLVNTSKTPETAKDTLGNVLPEKALGRTAAQIMQKHISDEKVVLTDMEFKNMIIDQDTDTSTDHTPVITVESDQPKVVDNDEQIITPWDVIS